jgi:hypothetical protein
MRRFHSPKNAMIPGQPTQKMSQHQARTLVTKSAMQIDSAPHRMKWTPAHPRLWYIQLGGGMLGRGRCHFVGETPRTKSGLFC